VHYWSLDRNIEEVSYSDTHGEVLATITVIESVGLMLACGTECADSMVENAMAEHGYKCLHSGDGPSRTLREMQLTVILTCPHVTYTLTSGIEIRAPWATTFEVDDGQSVAVLCSACESPVTGSSNTFGFPLEEIATMAYCCDEDASSLANSWSILSRRS
jgi:hypothetical protein